MIPGRLLHRLAVRICSTKTLEQIVEPAIADLHKEYHSAAAAHFLRRGRILIAGYCAILKVIAICAVSVAPVHDDERRALRRTVGWSLGMIILIAALLTLPPFFNHPSWGWYSLTTIAPQAVPLAIPIGIAFGLAFALAARPSRN